MSGIFNQIRPEDWVRSSKNRLDDEAELFGVRCIGSEAVGILSTVAGATIGLKFEQGSTVGAATGTTGDNPGTDGVVDCSSAGDALTFFGLNRLVNAVADWEMWLIDALPGDALYTGNTSNWLVVSDQEAQGADGYTVKIDTSVALYNVAALTFNGPSTEPHAFDAGALHELLQVRTSYHTPVVALSCIVYKVDDVLGTATAILTVNVPVSDATEVAFPDTNGAVGEPIVSTDAFRLVAKISGTTITAGANNKLFILGRSYRYGPGWRKNKLLSAY